MERGGYTRDRGDPTKERLTLEGAAALWTTPQARDHFPAHTAEYVAAKKAQGHGMRNLNDEAAHWRTLQAGDATRGSKSQRGVSSAYKDHWMTPKASDGDKGGPNMRGSKGDMPLPSQAANWSTPTARDHRSDLAGEKTSTDLYGANGIPLSRQAEVEWRQSVKGARAFAMTDLSLPDRPTPSGPKSSETRRRLNPLFVEWLMGWPEGLSGFDTEGTASCRSPQPLPGCGCMDCWLTTQRQALAALLDLTPPTGAQMALL